ncbi:hypothetical protein [Natronohydrobacter thiooxidans]|jgi:hypothetical protein|uniref:hypothetical protein n=1 Tax=Natronohydrobacter thiooxidans TaxID=87172 RepID=UPI0008FF5B30|nr:hypothetical protein [Natronohydrobacter thiooxidans]
MKKQTIIRGVAIVVAGISASVYGAQHLSGNRSGVSSVAQIAAPGSTAQIRSAGFLGGSVPSAPEDHAITVNETSFAALTEGTDLASGEAALDFAPQLEAAGNTLTPGGPDCTPRLTAHAAIDALIEVSLSAPCHPQERLVISHADLAFSAYTSENGGFSTYLPALSADGKIDIFLGEDHFLQTETLVPDVDAHIRVALQWVGDAEFSLHAYHMGARFGEAGHIHALKPFDADLDEAFLISLGDKRGPEPMLAEIYSIPTHLVGSSRVELALDFGGEDCGRDLSAFVLQSGGGAATEVNDASFATPDCPAQSGTLIMPLTLPAVQHAGITPTDGVFLSGVLD